MQHDTVITLNGRHWPALSRPDGVVIDFRTFAGVPAVPGYHPDSLRRSAVPEDLIAAAGESTPPGFVLITE